MNPSVQEGSPRRVLLCLLMVLVLSGCQGISGAEASPQNPEARATPQSSPSVSEPQDLQGLLDRLGPLWELLTSEREFTADEMDILLTRLQSLKAGLENLSDQDGPIRDQAIKLVDLALQELSGYQTLKELIEPLLAIEHTDPELFEKRVEKIRPQVVDLVDKEKERKAEFERLYHAMIATSVVSPFVPHGGLVGVEAPSWGVRQWRNIGKDGPPDVTDYRGKVLVLYCFQSWCPGCHETGFPTLKELVQRFEGNDRVAFVVVQTVFEGFETNTLQHGVETMKEFELELPLGHDPGENDSGSKLMKDYRQAGTPWIVLIDPQGVVRFNDYRIEPDKAEQMIEEMLSSQEARS
jgi:thiol-disulfide isomerase/thioredoxin